MRYTEDDYDNNDFLDDLFEEDDSNLVDNDLDDLDGSDDSNLVDNAGYGPNELHEEVEEERGEGDRHLQSKFKRKSPSKFKRKSPSKGYRKSPSKKDRRVNLLNRLKIIFSSIILIIVLAIITSYSVKMELFTKGSVGVEAVKLLYNFNNINELEDNLDELSSLMTRECYYRTTVLNSDKSLNTYLKFKKSRTKVNVLESKSGFVLYSLDNPNISPTRIFIFSYELNALGKIHNVKEFEAIDFYGSLDTNISDEELDKLIKEWESDNQ